MASDATPSKCDDTAGDKEDKTTVGAPTSAPPSAAASSAPSATAKRVAAKGKAAAAPPDDDAICSLGCCVSLTFCIVLIVSLACGIAYMLGADFSPVTKVLFGPAGLELTKETWDEHTAGKTVFVKFYAPWCGHCKRMAPDWDRLMREYKNHSVVLVAEVDCVGTGKAMCEEVGVKGFPTLKYGDPNALTDYSGGRTYNDLAEFTAGLGPMCGPLNPDLCSEEKQALLKKFQAMSMEQREEQIKTQEAVIEKLESEFKELVDGLSGRYKKAQEKKEEDMKSIKESGLSLLKAVEAFQAKAAEKKNEL